MVNHFYVYCMDRDFGPFFLNGHEYVKQHLANQRIRFEALDNSILSCADPLRVQAICDGLTAEKADGLLRKWFLKAAASLYRQGSTSRLPVYAHCGSG